MKICVLGGGGCFGLNLSRVALREGHHVLGIGRSPMKEACFALEFAHEQRNYVYQQRDIRDAFSLITEFNPDWIVNFAAQGEGAASFDPVNAPLFYATNTLGVVSLVEALRCSRWNGKFIQISTSELYGSVDAPADENSPLRPSSPYAVSKLAADMHLQVVAKHGFRMNIVRPSNCYTPGQQLHRVIPQAFMAALNGHRMQLHGGGRAEKSYLHADDLSRAILLIAEGPDGETYNVGPDEPVSIRKVVECCAKHACRQFDDMVEITDDRVGQDARYWLDSRKVKALGWMPRFSLDSGLFAMYAWTNAYRKELAQMPQRFEMRA